MRFPENVLEEIKARIDLVNLISRYVDLRRAGSNFKGLCPFHQEKTPSFMVSPAKGIYKCFGCGAAGGLFTFLRDIDSLSFTEAVRMLAKEAGVALPEFSDEKAQKEEQESERLYRINDAARAFFIRALASPEGARARGYLAERGIGAAAAEAFSLGFAPDSYDALKKELGRDFSEEDLLKAGLLAKREDGKTYDKFRRRLIFVIQNLSGLTCGFSGRVMDKNDNPKYLNSPETPVFRKGRLLYGLLQAREAIKEKNTAILVEGNVDLVTLFQGGVRNTAASLGTAFTDSHALLLKRFCENVIVLYDGDDAGQNSARRGLELLVNAGLSVRIVTLPGGEDPDSFFRKRGVEALMAALESGRDMVDFLIDHFEKGRDLSVPENKSRIVKELAPLLANIADPVVRTEYVRRAALRTGTREDFFLRAFAPSRRPAKEPGAAPGGDGQAPSGETAFQEKIIGLLLRETGATLPFAKRFLSPEDFTHPLFRGIFVAILEHGAFNDYVLALLPPEAQRLAAGLSFSPAEKDAGRAIEEMQGEIIKYKIKKLEQECAEVRTQTARTRDEGEKQELSRRFMDMTDQLKLLREEQQCQGFPK